MRYKKLIIKISIIHSVILVPFCLTSLILFIGCQQQQEDLKRVPPKNCMAIVTFEEIIVIKETDRFLDTWNVEVSIAPTLAPMQNAGQWIKIVNNVGGDRGARLITDDRNGFPAVNAPFIFGPTSLGPKNTSYSLKILVKSEEIDGDTTRVQYDITLSAQQIEYPNRMCPSDDIVMKFKQDVVDLSTGEMGQLEFRVRVKLDP